MIVLYVFCFASILLFLYLVISRILKYSNTPFHLRWELYPVAHEPEKNKYGGSYYEELNWWENKLKKSRVSETIAMLEEILLLKGVFKHNRKLWVYSFPFHIGLYLIIVTGIIIFLTALLDVLSIVSLNSAASLHQLFFSSIPAVLGYAGLSLTVVGCIGLIVMRLSDDKYKFYNTPMDIINLFFILILGGSVAVTFLYTNASFAQSKLFVRNLMMMNISQTYDTAFVIHIVLLSLFLMYFPITKMMHLFAKYFTFHKVRWDDEPNVKGGKIERKIKAALNYGVSWEAKHMKTGKTWAEVATNLPPEAKNES